MWLGDRRAVRGNRSDDPLVAADLGGREGARLGLARVILHHDLDLPSTQDAAGLVDERRGDLRGLFGHLALVGPGARDGSLDADKDRAVVRRRGPQRAHGEHDARAEYELSHGIPPCPFSDWGSWHIYKRREY